MLLIKKVFPAYRGNTNLHQIIRGNHILKNKFVRKNNENHKKSGKCSSCVSQLKNLCCKQVKQANIFKSYRTNQVFKIFHDATCKSENLIYLLQCQIYKF